MVECGNSVTVRHLSRKFPLLKESTVRLFKKQYMEELKNVGQEEVIKKFVKKKRDGPLTFGYLYKRYS